ncbi:hypothetical protein K438DRAFT_1775610 [Mycena galopus ATCC 62051]|nr:hypothetical protein K438DRAFT_1775610 [Mycena galopus ATCC 62051]
MYRKREKPQGNMMGKCTAIASKRVLRREPSSGAVSIGGKWDKGGRSGCSGVRASNKRSRGGRNVARQELAWWAWHGAVQRERCSSSGAAVQSRRRYRGQRAAAPYSGDVMRAQSGVRAGRSTERGTTRKIGAAVAVGGSICDAKGTCNWGNGMGPARGAGVRNAWRGRGGERQGRGSGVSFLGAGGVQWTHIPRHRGVHGTRGSAPTPGIILGAAAAGRRAKTGGGAGRAAPRTQGT